VTALKPIENTTRVRGVPAKRYPPNTICAVPGCNELAGSNHHIFGRPPGPDSDSWFVVLPPLDSPEEEDAADYILRAPNYEERIVPHVIGLCGSGTTGHHGDVEEHRAWIKLEEGEFVWYQRSEYYSGPPVNGVDGSEGGDGAWIPLGPLDPQPARGEKRKKAKRRQGEAARNAPTWSIRMNEEGQKGRLQDMLAELEERWLTADEKRRDEKRTPAFLFELALSYTLAHSGPEDFS
jgi:hypothetical protein